MCHRLDRLVSGCLVLARSKRVAAALTRCFTSGQVRKQYLARVQGHGFPADGVTIDAALGMVQLNPPLYGPVPISEGGKPASTAFEPIREYPDGTTLVLCRPVTGRTHQIRAHLVAAGFPIANDFKYGGLRDDVVPPPPPPRTVSDPLCPECSGDVVATPGEPCGAPVQSAGLGGAGARSRTSSRSMVPDRSVHATGIWLHAVRYCFTSNDPALVESSMPVEAREPADKSGEANERSWLFVDDPPPWAAESA